MLDFHRVSLEDKAFVKEKLKFRSNASCEYSFGNMFTYGNKIDIFIAESFSCLVVKCVVGNYASYLFPCGEEKKDIISALMEIEKDAKQSGKKACVVAMTEEDKAIFGEAFGEKYEVKLNRDGFDYVYNSEDLITLKGKKYQPKRNHISFFKKNMNWQYERITAENMNECLEMSRQWLRESESEFIDDLTQELKIIICIFENYDALGYVGGLIRVDGRVIAYTMGERISQNTFCVHIEKAFPSIRGAYPIINQQFVENELYSYKYINREDDVGKENLRKAKLSYYPAFLFEKYEAEIN